MANLTLQNKPLVEAIFELRWKIRDEDIDLPLDPNYTFLIGVLHSHLKDQYPVPEQLPTTLVPEDLASYLIQYRFRAERYGWPLIQLGPGIITLNDTDKYTWDSSFAPRIARLVKVFFESYSDGRPKVSSLSLRYINAVPFDFEQENVFDFLSSMLKMKVVLLESLFDSNRIESKPNMIDMRFTFPSLQPKGIITLRFTRGKHIDQDALVWETNFETQHADLVQTEEQIMKWAYEAHRVSRDWFFKIIEGDLQRRFK